MSLSTNQINTIYKIIAYSEYNTERKPLLEDILKIFLLNLKNGFNIKKESIKHQNNIISNIEIYRDMPVKIIFRDYDKIFSSMFIPDIHQDYLKKIFVPYEKEFSKYYNLKLSTYTRFSYFIHSYVNVELLENNFPFSVYEFEDKSEYTDLSFYGMPDKNYRNIYKKAVTIDIRKIIALIIKNSDIMEEEIHRVIDRLSFKINQMNDYTYLRFQDKPILQIDDNKYIVLFKDYLVNTLNQRLNVMFNNIRKYRENKGKLFEKLALKVINTIPKSKVRKNIKYNEFELDGILHLKNIDWFIECSSHPPQYSSFMDDEISIINDIQLSVTKCEEQALRAIKKDIILILINILGMKNWEL